MKLGELEAPGIYQGDCRSLFHGLPGECVQCVVTSPPYWGQRSYEGDQGVVWGGDPNCEHVWRWNERKTTPGGTVGESAKVGNTRRGIQRAVIREGWCACGAWHGAFGNEPFAELYIEHTMEILGHVWRVLRSDGVVFWNIGDSSMPDKSLALIPHRVALEAIGLGWKVRSDIIWAKGASFGGFVGNAMPESVTDRPTRAHEHVLMLTKSGKYYWDKDAVAEKAVGNPSGNKGRKKRPRPTGDLAGSVPWEGGETRNIRDVWAIQTKAYSDAHFATFPPALPEVCVKAASRKGDVVLDPFCGSGTTLQVADGLDRVWLGFDLAYDEVREDRLGPIAIAMAKGRLG